LLGRHIARLSERSRRDHQPIKDVLGVIPGNLVDLADLAAISGNHLPASPDQQPRNRISHLDSLTARAQQRWLEPCPQLGRAVRPKEKGERVAFPPNRDGVDSTHDESHRKDPQVVGDGEDGLTVSHAPNGVRCAELALHSGPGPKPATHQRAVRARRGAKATEFDCGASSCWIDRQKRSAPVVPTRNVET